MSSTLTTRSSKCAKGHLARSIWPKEHLAKRASRTKLPNRGKLIVDLLCFVDVPEVVVEGHGYLLWVFPGAVLQRLKLGSRWFRWTSTPWPDYSGPDLPGHLLPAAPTHSWNRQEARNAASWHFRVIQVQVQHHKCPWWTCDTYMTHPTYSSRTFLGHP